jgi:hypothetical protein
LGNLFSNSSTQNNTGQLLDNYEEGDEVENLETGEVLRLENGQWVGVQP